MNKYLKKIKRLVYYIFLLILCGLDFVIWKEERKEGRNKGMKKEDRKETNNIDILAQIRNNALIFYSTFSINIYWLISQELLH